MKQHLSVVLIRVSLVTKDAEHLHVLTGRLYVFFREMFIQIFFPL